MTDERIYRYPDGRTQRLGASLDDVPVANATDRTAPRREVVGLSGEVFGRYGEATIVRQADGREVVTWQPEDADYTEISRVAVEKMVAEVERLRNTVAAHEAYIRGQQAERDEALDAVRDATEKVAAAQREVSEARGALAEVARLRAAVAAVEALCSEWEGGEWDDEGPRPRDFRLTLAEHTGGAS